jgi:hypothetical protein
MSWSFWAMMSRAVRVCRSVVDRDNAKHCAALALSSSARRIAARHSSARRRYRSALARVTALSPFVLCDKLIDDGQWLRKPAGTQMPHVHENETANKVGGGLVHRGGERHRAGSPWPRRGGQLRRPTYREFLSLVAQLVGIALASCVYRKLRLGCSGDAVHRGEHVR